MKMQPSSQSKNANQGFEKKVFFKIKQNNRCFVHVACFKTKKLWFSSFEVENGII